MRGVDKATLTYGAQSLLDRAVAACAGAATTVVVAPESLAPAGVRRALEDPPFGGPVAGIAAGLADLGQFDPAQWVLVLAVDHPESPAAVAALLAAADDTADVDAYAAVAGDGFRQHLLTLYRRAALEDALARLGGTQNRSVRRLVDGLRFVDVPLDARTAGDVDDPDAARSYGIEVPHAP